MPGVIRPSCLKERFNNLAEWDYRTIVIQKWVETCCCLFMIEIPMVLVQLIIAFENNLIGISHFVAPTYTKTHKHTT